MGYAMLSSWLDGNKNRKLQFHIVEKNKKTVIGVIKKYKNLSVSNNIPINWKGDLIVFSVKPQSFKIVSKEILKNNVKYKSVVSIMAGISVSNIRKALKTKLAVTRVMPNIAVSIKQGVCCIFHSKNSEDKNKNNIEKLFKILGSILILENEKLLNSVTAISGSGPAYFFLFFSVFENITRELGFNKKNSKKIVYQTIRGALELSKKESKMSNLINSVKSKKGTTEAALKILEKKNSGMYFIMKKAIEAAVNRADQLSKLS